MKTIINNTKIVKDKTKCQKIVAAIYLVTRHLSDTDPFRQKLRTRALGLLSEGADELASTAAQVLDLLSTAVFAGLITELNVSIIAYEIKKYVEGDALVSEVTPAFFGTKATGIFQKDSYINKTNDVLLGTKNTSNRQSSFNIISNDKESRRENIMSFMREKKSATIKDISALFPSISEKTIQRELGVLVLAGKLSKRGNKRWSVYVLA